MLPLFAVCECSRRFQEKRRVVGDGGVGGGVGVKGGIIVGDMP